MGIPTVFQTPVTVPLHSPNGRHTGWPLCKGTVKESNNRANCPLRGGLLAKVCIPFPKHRLEAVGKHCYAVNWCVSRWNGRDTMDVIFFFHITSGRINTWKGVNQLKELFFLNLIIILKNIYQKLTNHRPFMIINPLFFTIHNKNGVLL